MPIIDFPHNLLEGLSDFWQRFFNEADQLDALYRGSAILMGQAYLDMLSNVLNVSLKDAPIFNKEYFKLVTIREDQIRYDRGASVDDDRFVYDIADDLVTFASLDNRVFEPTRSLQERLDYDLGSKEVRFAIDPTDPDGSGSPLPGYARRGIDVAVGGAFDDSTRPIDESWFTRGVRKGDTIRILEVGPDVTDPPQRMVSEHPIVLVRDKLLFVNAATPLVASTAAKNYVILRSPPDNEVEDEALLFSGDTAELQHERIDVGSVRVFAKRLSDGADVVEDGPVPDYVIDYEKGKLIRKTTWTGASANKINYAWKEEAWPDSGLEPRSSSTGVVRSGPTTTRVIQMALWAPDALVDRRVLANNFGSLIGVEQASSENYRAFLRGIFQLYLLGPVLERIESALNVILGFPVVRDDGEVFLSLDTTTEPTISRVTTNRPSTNQVVTYDFPKGTAFRPDLIPANAGNLILQAFEPFTTAVTVTDYIQDPDWWRHTVIPPELFSKEGDGTTTTASRRTVTAPYIKHIYGAPDKPRFGDPGLKFGADENGFIPPPGHPIFRHKLAFVLMDQYLKFHTFFVRFDPTVFADTGVGVKFARSFNDLNALIFSAKPSHTYLLAQPTTTFEDEVTVADAGVYQPQRYTGADPDAPEIYSSVGALPDAAQAYSILGLTVNFGLGTPPDQQDRFLFTDRTMAYGVNGWAFGDYFFYEEVVHTVSFPAVGTPVSLPNAIPGPRFRRLVRVYVDTVIGARRLVEYVDYTVNYETGTVTRLTAWDDTTSIDVKVLQLNIGNVVDAPADQTLGDMPLMLGNIDPATVTGDFSDEVDWAGDPIPTTDARDMAMVERPVILTVASVPELQ